jgi:hypothetical protein
VLSSCARLDLQRGVFIWQFPTKTLCAFLACYLYRWHFPSLYLTRLFSNGSLDCALAQMVSLRPLTAEARFRTRFRQSMWDLWWTKWQWDRFFSEFFCFAVSLSFHHDSPCSYIAWETNNRPVGGRSSETSSYAIDMNNRNIDSLMEPVHCARYSSQFCRICFTVPSVNAHTTKESLPLISMKSSA